MIAALYILFQVSGAGPENWAYITCLTSSAQTYLQSNLSRPGFARYLESACPSEKAALRRVVLERQMNRGRTRSQAEGDAKRFFEVIQAQMLDLQPSDGR